MGEFSAWHLLILAALFVILFGSKKLPDAARSLGRSMRILKAETRQMREDSSTPAHTTRPIEPPVADPRPTAPTTGADAETPASARHGDPVTGPTGEDRS